MADKEPALKERVQKAADSPMGRRVREDVEYATGAGTVRRAAEAAQRAWKGRKKQNRGSAR